MHCEYEIVFVLALCCFKATFNNISVISWRSALLAKETEGPVENQRTATGH